jgi:hypothetical protein
MLGSRAGCIQTSGGVLSQSAPGTVDWVCIVTSMHWPCMQANRCVETQCGFKVTSVKYMASAWPQMEKGTAAQCTMLQSEAASHS